MSEELRAILTDLQRYDWYTEVSRDSDKGDAAYRAMERLLELLISQEQGSSETVKGTGEDEGSNG